mgnify:CR=1 FL=1
MKDRSLNDHLINPITGWLETRLKDRYEEKAKINKAVKERVERFKTK